MGPSPGLLDHQKSVVDSSNANLELAQIPSSVENQDEASSPAEDAVESSVELPTKAESHFDEFDPTEEGAAIDMPQPRRSGCAQCEPLRFKFDAQHGCAVIKHHLKCMARNLAHP